MFIKIKDYIYVPIDVILCSQMLSLLILLIQWRVIACTSSPTLEDNMLPTDEEVFSDLIKTYRGQPEQEIALNLPTDEQALNEIKTILQSGNPFYYTGSTGRFLSSSFPGIIFEYYILDRYNISIFLLIKEYLNYIIK